MIRVLIKPAKRPFSRRQQWTWEIRSGNGELIDPRETYYNRGDAIAMMEKLLRISGDPVELVVLDRQGNVEEHRRIR